mmetsp:Transcript_8824/g.12812  ORF Transcript_8824/g.12812 Transcript_8824/m.12812 type:complete len:160 (-) Transcript_8824:245-724(-)
MSLSLRSTSLPKTLPLSLSTRNSSPKSMKCVRLNTTALNRQNGYKRSIVIRCITGIAEFVLELFLFECCLGLGFTQNRQCRTLFGSLPFQTKVTRRFFRVFFAFYQLGQIESNLITSFIVTQGIANRYADVGARQQFQSADMMMVRDNNMANENSSNNI